MHSESELIEMASGRPPNLPMPIPTPGEEPKKPLPPGKDQKKPAKRPLVTPHVELPVPEVVKKHFVEKRGLRQLLLQYAEPTAGLEGVERRGRTSAAAPWTLSGPLEKGRFRFQITDEGVSLTLPSSERHWTAGDNLAASLAPPDSGGLFAALYLWRRLACEGPARFGELRYARRRRRWSAMPGLVDVLTGTHKGVECRFYFDPGRRRSAGDSSCFPTRTRTRARSTSPTSDEMDGRLLPRRMAVRFGDRPFAVFKVDEFKVEKRERGRKDAK